jgi:hypothetical protein
VLNLYDTEAVKAFIFNILVENQELKQKAADAQSTSDMWFKDYQTQRERADKAEARVAELEKLVAERNAALTDKEGGAEL